MDRPTVAVNLLSRLGGPIGAAVGAGIGRISRKCTFVLKIDGDVVIVAVGWKFHFNAIEKALKISRASKGGSA